MLAVSAGTLGEGTSLAPLVDSVSGVDRKPTPILLLPVDGRLASALQADADESWRPAAMRRRSERQSTARFVDDASYRYKRLRNNEAARRSRQKRRQQDGAIRHQLEALAAENRELRCQLALLRRLLDEVAAGTLPLPFQKDRGTGGGVLQPGWSLSSIASSAALSTASDQPLIDDVTADEGKLKVKDDGHVESTDVSDWTERQLLKPLNLSQRVTSS